MPRSDSPGSFPPPLRPIPLDLYPNPSPSSTLTPYQQHPHQQQQQQQQQHMGYHSASSPVCPCSDCRLTPASSEMSSSRHSSFAAATTTTSSSSSSFFATAAAATPSGSLGHSTITMNPALCSPCLPSAAKDAVSIAIPPPPSHAEYGSSSSGSLHHHGSLPPSASLASSWSQTSTAHHYPHHHHHQQQQQQQQQQQDHQQQRSFSTAPPPPHQNHHQQQHYNHPSSLSTLPASDSMPVAAAAPPPALIINTSFLHQPPHSASGSHHSSYQHAGSSAPSSAGVSMSQHHQHPASGTGAPVRAKIPVHHHHPATLAQLADFAAHMVCHLLFGHQAGAASPLSPMPISPQPTTNCHCSACLQQRADSPTAAEGMLPSPVSARPSHVYYDHATCANRSPPTPRSAMSARPTHRRLYSESTDAIPPPTALFRKFCLDVLSATQLSRSVILLSLKYIEKLMIHLKISNKIVNTGEGAEYRFFTGALILANKFLDDNTFTNKTWAEITGMKMVDVNHLEMQFLNGIDFRLFTSPEEYQEWLSALTHFASKHLPALSTVPSHSQPLPAHQHPHPAYQQQPAPLPSQQPTASHHGYGGQHQSHHSTQMRTPISPVDWAPHHSHSHPSAGQDAYELGSYAGQSGSNRSGYPEHPPHPQMPLPGQLPTGAVTNRSSQRMPLSSSYAGYETGTTSARHVAAGKRSAYQAFDDPMEDATLPSSSSTLPPHGPTHKRASLSLSAGMSLLDVNSHPHHHHHHQQHQQQPQQHQQQHTQSLRTLHERSSHGSLRRSYKLGALSTHPYHSHAAAPSSMETHALSHQQHPHQHQQPSHHYLPPSQPRLHVSGSSSRRSHMRTLSDSSFGNHGGRYQHEGYLAPPAHVPAPVALAGPVVGLARNEQPSSSHRSSWSSSARPMSMQAVGDEVHIAVPPPHHSHSHHHHQHHAPQPQPVYEACSCQSRYPHDNGCGCPESGRPRQMSTAGTPSSVTMATTTSAAAVVPSHPFYPTPPPFAPSDKYGHATASMVMGGEPSETRVAMPSSMAVNGPAGGPAYSPHHYPHHHHHHHPSEFEFDPRMWAPFDSLSLYAITSQAAKRVVAHSKVLSASASNLHVYYPTSLA